MKSDTLMTDKFPLESTSKCPFGNEGKEEHPCPYEIAINNHPEFRCICCDECEKECVKEAWY